MRVLQRVRMLGLAAAAAFGLGLFAAEPVKVGAILAVTGPASNLGAPEARTVEMLVEQINKAGGIKGAPIKLLVKDSAGNPEKAFSLAKQLIEEENVLAILGPSTSGETMKIKQLCEENRVILISCAAAEVIVNPVAKYVFKTPQKDSQAAAWIFESMKKKNITKVGIVADNGGFGQAGKKQLEELAPKAGLTIVASETYDAKATDLTDILAKVRGAGEVQAIINWSIVPAQSIVAKNMKQMGFDVPLYQSHGFGNIKYVEAAGAAADGILFPAGRLLVAEGLAADHPQKALLLKYKQDYETKFKEDVSTFGGHAYDALTILVAAIEKAGTDREKVRDAIETLRGFVGTAGVFNFSPEDHNGLGMDAFEMLTVKGGKFVLANE